MSVESNLHAYVSFNKSFEEAVEKVKTLPKKPSDDEMLKLYGLYKQATVGNNNVHRPSFWDLVGKAKWDSWDSFKDYSIEKSKEEYIKYVEYLTIKYL